MSRRKLTPEYRSTEWVAEEGLKIPVFDMSLVTEYENSWQFSIWYSESAIETDIATPTKVEAKKLADLQNNRLQLAKYLVEQHDKKAAFQANINESDSGLEDEADEKTQRNESRLISILRNDKLGQLLDFPKVVDFMQ